MAALFHELVRERAGRSCEYCRLPDAASSIPFEIDHIIARKHGGDEEPGNLAYSCFFCNSYKGSNIAGLDPQSRQLSRLFHPRRDRWRDHFRWEGPTLVGVTPVGRTTAEVLTINATDSVLLRGSLIGEGIFPPPDLAVS